MRVNKIKLIDGTELTPGNFNVIIGGNAVGKTTLLMELYAKTISTQPTRWRWIDTIDFTSPDLSTDLNLIFHSLVSQREGANLFYYSPAAKNIDGNADLSIRLNSEEWQELKNISEGQPIPAKDYFSDVRFRKPLVSLLNCETRLNLPSQTSLTPIDQQPSDPINVLFRNKRLLQNVSTSIQEQFSLQIALLMHRLPTIDLGLANASLSVPRFDIYAEDIRQESENIEQWKEPNFIPVQEIGHGIRSMLRLLIGLLDPVNQVILIDEPEMHLYPSQKRWLGRELVRLAISQRKQVFIVTHDPIILQGILDTRSSTSLFRVEINTTGQRKVKLCTLQNISDIGARRNQDSYLQGLFYQRCIAVEGASDRGFYQTMVEENYPSSTNKDLGFVACGGKGATKNVASIVSKVGLRCAFIYDFDALVTDLAVINEVFVLFGGDTMKLQNLNNLIAQITSSQQAPQLPEIKQLEKEGLLSVLGKQHQVVFTDAIITLASVGIFIVPNGGLESWAPTVEPKYRFPELAPDVLQADPILRQNFDQFIRPVLQYLNC